MALETSTYINGLVAANPLGTDQLAYAADHLRLIKSTLLNTFPGIKGPVTVTHENLNNGTPVGLISMWNGNPSAPPPGWTMCNGVTVARADGTGNITPPDLRDRFIIGAGYSYATGNTGGNALNYLSVAQMPGHTHTGSTNWVGDHNHSGNTSWVGDHQHGLPNLGSVQAGSDNGGANVPVSTGYGSNRYMSPTDAAGGHFHSFTTSNAGGHNHVFTTDYSGSGAAIENRPPFYALCFIMKI
jgi:hypothetical protein